MENVITQKVSKCVEWTLQMTHPSTSISDSFSLQNSKCHLEFFSGAPAKLYLKCDENLFPLTVTVRMSHVGGSFIDRKESTITSSNTSIYSNTGYFGSAKYKFEVVFILDVETSQNDKSVQVSPYTDVCFSLESLSHDFSKLFLGGPDHDVEFTVGDQTIKAHKIILCARSTVFSSMLQSDMVEGKTGRVKIEDMDAVIFKQFLKCLYTGKLPEITIESAIKFYEAFDKYGVECLKKLCAQFLMGNLTHENVCDILALSDRHSDEDFKKNVIEYVVKENIVYIGEKWEDFCTENPKPAFEVYRLFCEQFRSK